jgi:hypothetical protein
MAKLKGHIFSGLAPLFQCSMWSYAQRGTVLTVLEPPGSGRAPQRSTRKKTVREAEARHAGHPGMLGMEKPFGFLNAQWEALKAAMLPEDELYAFHSSPESWQARAGRRGFALVRNGKVVRRVVTILN